MPPAEPDDWEVPPPVLLNTWKHHAGAIRRRIAAADAANLEGLPRELVVIGGDLMDLYVGALTPRAIAEGVTRHLGAEGVDAPERFRAWVRAAGGYRMLELEDGSVWALREGTDPARYVHLHPGRRAPRTRRVRANVLKTAVLALAHARVFGGDPFDTGLVNEVRRRLGLPPVPALSKGEGLGEVIELLRRPGESPGGAE
ncbi:MAG TPA: hypothetical protein VIL46_04595 [Gemmataceae bacterium]